VKRNFKPLVTFIVILAQSALAVALGVVALSKASANTLPAGACVEALHIGSLTREEAVAAVESKYTDELRFKSLRLIFGEDKEFEIPFSQIEAYVDASETVGKLMPGNGFEDAFRIFKTYFGQSEQNVVPVIKYNEGKLRAALVEIADKVYVPPVDAQIGVSGGVVVKKPETPGRELNISNTVETIYKQLSSNPWEPVAISDSSSFEFQPVEPLIKIKDFDDIQQVFAEYTIFVADDELLDSVRFAVDAINGVFIEPYDSSGDVFSLVEILKNKDKAFETDNEGYDQVASALYAALLSAGLPTESITRVPHKLRVDYIEPGLDAWISGNAGDLKFTNPFKHKIAVFASVERGMINVAIAGHMSDDAGDFKLETEIVQKVAPPVYYVENNNLKPGEKRVLSAGKDGLVVNVLRNGEIIGTDTYEAEKAIIQIGPDTDWKNENK